MSMRKICAWGAVLITVALPSAVVAHHSTADLVDRDIIREIEGEVVTVLWRNPHVSLKIRTQGADGAEELWTLEGHTVFQLDNGGVSRDAISVEDHVRASGNESTLREFYLGRPSVLMPDGTEISLWGRPRYFSSSGEFLIGSPDEGAISAERVAVSRERANGIFRVWSRSGEFDPFGELPLTDTARAAQATWHAINDDAARRCVPPGMPRAMSTNPFPIEFIPEGEDIVLRLQEFDTRRLIRMNEEPPGDDTPSTPLGYSVGRWEDQALIVSTTRINYPLFDRLGVPQSDQVAIEERFTLSDNETVLAYQITVNDPATFAEPVVGGKVWAWIPGVEIQAYECAVLVGRE